MLKVALTGGIGSGKSTVSDHLAALGAAIIDTDLLSRELTTPGHPVLALIAEAFGPGVLREDGGLDRAALRRLAFADAPSRARLEAILHPRIRELMLMRLAEVHAPYAVLVIPLLLETGQAPLADRVLLVDVPREVQIRRVQSRSRLELQEIERILASQVGRDERLARADDVIDNSGDLCALLAQVESLHQRYLALAALRARRGE